MYNKSRLAMLKGFYDSLETLQKVDYASKKDYINLGLGVLVSVVVFGAFFIGIDTIASAAYKTLYGSLRGDAAQQLEQQTTTQSGAQSLDTLLNQGETSTGNSQEIGQDETGLNELLSPSLESGENTN